MLEPHPPDPTLAQARPQIEASLTLATYSLDLLLAALAGPHPPRPADSIAVLTGIKAVLAIGLDALTGAHDPLPPPGTVLH